MFKNYASFTGIEFVVGNQKHGEDAYFEDLIVRATRGSGRNPKNINLVIAADQLLNTLYVDRSLELQGLIQAYSRTNRIYNSTKEFGSIINFQYPSITEELVNQALTLYGDGGKSSRAIVEQYSTATEKLEIKMSEMIATLPDPTTWQTIENDEENKKPLFMLIKMLLTNII